MSDVDRRLRRALGGAVEQPSSSGVLERVAARRERRRRVRQQRWAAAAIVIVATVGVGAVLTADGSEPSTRVAAPGGLTVPEVRVVDGTELDERLDDLGRSADVARLRLAPDGAYVRGPILASDASVAFATYDRVGTGFTFPPSRVVRVNVPGGTVVDEVELQGEIVALADGEGARWVLTRDKEVLGPDDPRFRVKRIAPDGSVVSNAVPPAEEPLGEIVAGGGGVWVSARDGVLRFDPASGELASKVALPPAEARGLVAAGKAVYVSTPDAVLRLDPASDAPIESGVRVGGGAIVDLGAGLDGELLQLVVGGAGPARVDVDSTAASGRASIALPDGIEPRALHSTNGVVWVDATLDGSPVAVVLDERLRSVERIVVLPGEADTVVVVAARDRAVLASHGEAWVVDLG